MQLILLDVPAALHLPALYVHIGSASVGSMLRRVLTQ
jgi:hypothetical protein